MERTVKLYYYDATNGKEVEVATGCDLLINGVSAPGTTTQTDDELVFSHNSVFPGGGGYAFSGWSFSSNGGIGFIPANDETITLNAIELDTDYLEVRCVLSANVYTITYNYNNPSSTGSATQEVTFGDENVTLLFEPPYTGYVFKGWSIGGTLYASESAYTPTVGNVTADAQWVSVSDESVYPAVQIDYQQEDEEGALVDWEKALALLGVATKLKTLANTEAAVFSGWIIGGSFHKSGSTYQAKDGTGGTTVTATPDYKKRTISVRFDTKGGKPQPAPISGQFGSLFTMPAAPSKSGYTFVSWSYNGGCWAPGEKAQMNKEGAAYAIYSEQKIVQVTFDSNRGSEIPEPERYKTVEVGKVYGGIFPTDPTLKNCKFLGWFTSPSDNSGYQVLAGTVVRNPSNHTLYARWSNEKVLFNPNGGTISGDPKEIAIVQVAGQLIVMPPSIQPPSDGRYPVGATGTFGGWYTSASSGGTQITDSYIIKKNENLRVWARWAQCVYFDKNASDAYCDVAYKMYFADNKYTGLPDESKCFREGYDLLGWFTEPEHGHEVGAGIDVSIQTKRTLYAHWAVNAQEVTFNGMGGSVNFVSKKFAYPGKYEYVSEVVAERENFKFIGWFTGEYDGTEVTDATDVTSEGTRTLYAHYVSQIKVVFDAYGGSFSNGSSTTHVYYTKGEPYLEFPSCTKTGKSFLGYFTSTSGGTRIRETDLAPDQAELWVYAHWDDTEQCAVTIDADGGACSVSAMTKYKDNKMGSMPVPTKDGYSFDGFYRLATLFALSTDAFRRDDTGKVTGDTIVTGDMTIKAKWVKKILLYYVVGAV